MTKEAFVLKVLKIGRMTYDRLASGSAKPQLRTVQKVSAGIGIPIEEAMLLAGYDLDDETRLDAGVDVLVHDVDGRVKFLVKDFQRDETERQLDVLRKAGRDAGRTLGDVLVGTGLAEPEELRLTTQKSSR